MTPETLLTIAFKLPLKDFKRFADLVQDKRNRLDRLVSLYKSIHGIEDSNINTPDLNLEKLNNLYDFIYNDGIGNKMNNENDIENSDKKISLLLKRLGSLTLVSTLLIDNWQRKNRSAHLTDHYINMNRDSKMIRDEVITTLMSLFIQTGSFPFEAILEDFNLNFTKNDVSTLDMIFSETATYKASVEEKTDVTV